MKTTEQLKISVAENHGYKNGVLGNAWDLAMQITHRTKSQIQLYEELLSETVKQFENKLRWISVEEKEPECFENEEDGIYYSKYLELKVNGYEYPLIGYYVYASDDQFFDIISEKDDNIKQEDITHYRECFL